MSQCGIRLLMPDPLMDFLLIPVCLLSHFFYSGFAKEETDGIDLSASNVLIDGFEIHNGDDVVNVAPPATNVTVRNSRLLLIFVL
jgi:hypothetical protein